MSDFTPHIPRFPLSEYIECLWSVKAPMTYKRERILPTGMMDLIINLGTPYKILDNKSFAVIKETKHCWITGFHTESILSEATSSKTDVIGVRFKPTGAYPFFGFPMSELHNELIDLDLIWGNFAYETKERLLEADALAMRFSILEEILLQKLRAEFYGFKTIHYAVGQITGSEAFTSIRDLSNHIGISQKHLIHLFRKAVGVAPKTLSRVYKFLEVLRLVDPAKSINWAEVAYACNYYDQAHFNKDFAAFSGVNPTTYLKQRNEFFGDDLQKGEDIHFVPIG